MKIVTPRPRHSLLVDRVVLAYVEWREESASVWDAYDHSARARAEDKVPADAAYRAALDREEAAAKTYAELIALARDRLGAACDLFLAERGSD